MTQTSAIRDDGIRRPDSTPERLNTERHPYGNGFPIELHDESGTTHETLHTYQLIEFSPQDGVSLFFFAADVKSDSEAPERTVLLQRPDDLDVIWKLNESKLCYESFSIVTCVNPDSYDTQRREKVPVRGYKLNDYSSFRDGDAKSD